MISILIMDDEEEILKLVKMSLNQMGYSVETSETGEEGLLMFDEYNYDLVITDFNMPGIDGNEVASHIRTSNRPYTPIIGISGNPLFFQNNRFDATVQKPFLIKTLVDTILKLTYPLNKYDQKSVKPFDYIH